MSAVLMPGRAAALPQNPSSGVQTAADVAIEANLAWEVDRALMLDRSERRAWWVAIAGFTLGLLGIAAVFAQGPLRRVIEIPIVVDRVTGEATIQQRLAVETIPPMEALDKHSLATFVRAREGYSWMFLQRDFDQVARMSVPAVFADYNRQFEGDTALHKKVAATQDWRIHIIGVRLTAAGRSGNSGEATVTYDKVVRLMERNLPDLTTRHVASVVFRYQPKVLAKEGGPAGEPLRLCRHRLPLRPGDQHRCPGSQAMNTVACLLAPCQSACVGCHRPPRAGPPPP